MEVEIIVSPSNLENLALILKKALKKSQLKNEQVKDWKIIRKSIDARKKEPVFRLRIQLFLDDFAPEPQKIFVPQILDTKKDVLIIGAGPAGYFAAMQCLSLGIKPILVDRGKDVQSRRRDLRAIQQEGIVNPDSNYCFGEGGAGTYSDGKLYTRSHKRGKISDILSLLVEHGANSDILIDAHPHIGSNKLPKIISQIRHSIESNGGEVHFNSRVVDFIIKNGEILGVKCTKEDTAIELFAQAVILATGHSARDIFTLCESYQLEMEAKPFALGVRMEHPQALIDEIQYNQKIREKNLPASSYRLACQIEQTGVFSFCMCPGGLIVPASTSPGEIVVNGMSLSKRDSPYANSGIVVEVSVDYLKSKGYLGLFAGVNFQKSIESAFFDHGDGTQKAPAQKLTDFLNAKITDTEMKSSYIPGLIAAPVHNILPKDITQKIRGATKVFDRKLKGFLSNEAHVIGVESRTSSPIRIHRHRENYMSPNVKALFPCGEGAGYAGGILSAALDGRNVAKAVAEYLDSK